MKESVGEEGLYAEIGVFDDEACPIASCADERVVDVRRVTNGGGEVIEEFTAEPGIEGELNVRPVFQRDDGTVYRFDRERGGDCVCDTLAELGHPTAQIRVQDGGLVVGVHVENRSGLGEVMETLRGAFDSITLRYLCSETRSEPSELVLVDRAQLTDKQEEALSTAYDRGYFDYPRGTNASEIAEELGVSLSTFMNHLVAAQAKLLDAVVTEQ